MLTKTVTYTDYNGVSRTEDFFFNLSKSELAEMELGVDGGFSAFLQKIIATQNMKELMVQFKRLILKAYGEKSPDGKRFIKSSEISEAFSQTEAYTELFFEMMDAQKSAEFVNGIIPQKLTESKEFKEAQEKVLSINSTK